MAYEGFGLAGKRVLVTGGSIGIGAAAARAFHAAGARVAIHYRSHLEEAQQVAAACGDAPVFAGDFTVTAEVEAVVRGAIEALGGLDVLVNNAGHMVRRVALAETDDAIFDTVVNLNARSVVTACRVALPALTASRGTIINVSSISARAGGSPGAGLYSAAKGFVSTWTRALATELAPVGIRVNAVSPGVITTYFHEIYSTPEKLEAVRQRIPQARLGTSEDCAGTILYLASDVLSSYVTGAGGRGQWWAVDAVSGAEGSDPAVLIEAARAHFVEALMPLVPAERRYDAAMVQNALAVALRRMARGSRDAAAERARVTAFLEAHGHEPGAEPSATLAMRLRDGSLDAVPLHDLVGLLAPGVTDRLAVANPKASPPRWEHKP